MLAHPLPPQFPDWARLLDPPALPIGGGMDTVLACGDAAFYGALSRYAFHVGAWENSRWSAFHGASGLPGSPHCADQHPVRAGNAVVPMTYGWDRLAAGALWIQALLPG